MAKATYQIHPDLAGLAFSVDSLNLLPGNPKKGDVEAVMASYQEFGQRKPIVCRWNPDGDTGTVLAGNTQLQAARRLDWKEIAVTWVDDDDKKAAAFALADNKTADLGSYDEAALYEMMKFVENDPILFDATGYTLLDMEDLKAQLEDVADFKDFLNDELSSKNNPFDTKDDDEGDDDFIKDEGEPEEKKPGRPVIQYAIIFDNEQQQQRFFAFVRWLKKQYESEDTLAGRLDAYLETVEFE